MTVGGPVGQRPVDDVAVPGDPADVGGAPVDVSPGLWSNTDVVGVRGLGEVAAGGVQDALRLPGGARGVEDEQRVLGVERLGVVRVGLAVDEVVPPHVATLGPRHVDPGAPDHQHVLDRWRSRATASSTFSFSGAGLPRRYWPSAVITSLACASAIRAAAPRREPAEDHAVHRAEPGAGQHRDDRLGDHRQVDRHPVAGLQPELGQRVRGLADLALQVGVGDGAGVARLALPVDRDLLAVPGLDVPVDAVDGDVELAVGEPLRERRVGQSSTLSDFGPRSAGRPARPRTPPGRRRRARTSPR